MRGRYKKWAAPFLESHPDIAFASIDANDPFFQSEKRYLEIGIGKGDFIIQMSSLLDGAFLGLERDVSVCGIAAKKVEASERKNIRVGCFDFDDVYEDLKPLSFDIIFLNFSDPWPKKKHAKRRLTYAPRLTNIGKLLKSGGEIRIKTDNPILYESTLEQIPLTDLQMVYNTDNYVFDAEKDAMSEYERNFREKGQPIHRIILKKEQQ